MHDCSNMTAEYIYIYFVYSVRTVQCCIFNFDNYSAIVDI